MQQGQYKIFMSVGATYTQKQSDFVQALEAYLTTHSCERQTVGTRNHSVRQPIEHARQLISECDGAVVVAFERTRIVDGLEKPASPDQKPLCNEAHPTVWNHLEGAMAYAQGVPMFVIVETGLKRQGVLSDRFEWQALETDIDARAITTDKFTQFFQSWLERVQAHKARPLRKVINPAEIRIHELFSHLTTKQFLGLLAGLIGVLGTIATIAYKMGVASMKP